MANMMDNVKTVNSVVRTGIFLAMTAGIGFGGYFGYNNYIKPGLEANEAKLALEQLKNEFESQSAKLEQTLVENDKIKASIQLLKVDRRLANVEVLEKSENEEGEPTLLVRFTEYNEFGEAIGSAKDFELRGDKMYVDCWVVKFGDKYVEQADALRSASLCVFKGIYGNLDGPEGSKPLETDSSEDIPTVYTNDRKSAFAQKIWSDFWRLANDQESQEELGIRAVHGQANYMKVEAGRTYEVKVRSSGAASLEPVKN